MAYADKTFYRNTYQGRVCADDDTLDKWLQRASDDIDIVTGFGFVFDDLNEAQQLLVKRATCQQAEDYIVNGDSLDDFDSFSLGAFSIKESGRAERRGGVCFRALTTLGAGGLTFTGVSCGRSR